MAAAWPAALSAEARLTAPLAEARLGALSFEARLAGLLAPPPHRRGWL